MIAKILNDGEKAKKLREKGIYYYKNATTSYEYCSYYVIGHKENAEELLDMMIDCFFNMNIDWSLLEAELASVAVEVYSKKNFDNTRLYLETLPRIMYDKHTGVYKCYLDHGDVAENIKREDVENYLNNVYKTKMSQWCFCGSVESIYGNPKLNKISKIKCIPHKKTSVPKILENNDRVYLSKKNSKVSTVVMSFYGVSMYDIDIYGISLFKMMMSGLGLDSILSDVLRKKYKVAYSPRMMVEYGYDYGYLAFDINTKHDNVRKVIDVLYEVIENLDEYMTENRFILAHNALKLRAKKVKSVQELEDYYGYKLLFNLPLETEMEVYNNHIKDIELSELKDMIKKYLDVTNPNLVIQLGPINKIT